MRVLSVFTLALLLVGSAAAQEQSAASDARIFSQSMIHTKQAFVITEPQLKIAALLPPFDRRVFVSPGSPEASTCWFIRSYIFEREDGEAPVLKGETTCTPSSRNFMRQTKKRHAEFQPLVW